MKLNTFPRILATCVALASGSVAQAAEFDCPVVDIFFPTTKAIKDKFNEVLPQEVHNSDSRIITLDKAKSVSSSGCKISTKFDSTLIRENKVIPSKREVTGSLTIDSEINILGCMQDIKVTNVDYNNTTNISEQIIKKRMNKRVPDEICIDENGNINFDF